MAQAPFIAMPIGEVLPLLKGEPPQDVVGIQFGRNGTFYEIISTQISGGNCNFQCKEIEASKPAFQISATVRRFDPGSTFGFVTPCPDAQFQDDIFFHETVLKDFPQAAIPGARIFCQVNHKPGRGYRVSEIYSCVPPYGLYRSKPIEFDSQNGIAHLVDQQSGLKIQAHTTTILEAGIKPKNFTRVTSLFVLAQQSDGCLQATAIYPDRSCAPP